MGLFEHWPYTNFHDLNLDWIIKKLPEVFTASAQAVQSAETAVSAKDDAVAAKEDAQSSAENAALSEENAGRSAESAQDYAEHIADPVSGLVTTWLDDNITPTTPPIDRSLTVQDAAADAKATGDAINDLQAQILQGIPYEVKNAINNILQNVAYKNDTDYSADKTVINQWATNITVLSISAVYTQISPVYSTDSLDVLRDDLVVTASFSNGTSGTVTGYTLSGSLEYGDSVITVAYGGQTATFTVSVTDVYIVTLESGNFNELSAVGTAFNSCKGSTAQRMRNANPLAIQPGDVLMTSADGLGSGEVVSMYLAYFDADALYTGVHSSDWEGAECTIAQNYPYVGVSMARKPTNTDKLTQLTNITLKRIRSPQ